MTDLREHTIAVPDEVLDDLRRRLEHTRLPGQVAGIGWEQGTELGYLSGLLDHWRTAYDWRRVEAELNAIPQVVTEVEGQRIHALHARSAHPGALPLLLVHGWPGSVVEFLDALPLLREDFHVVAPSLPGFAFSGPTSERGWHPRRMAAAFGELMARLGYDRYGLQGGDWGSLVCANVADLHPDRAVGLHVNMVTAAPPVPGATLTPEEEQAKAAGRAWRREGTGYQRIQGTRPQSLGYALQDSPAGLAGWVAEKFRAWSHAEITEAFTPDRLLDNITTYWVTGTATSSLRVYWETQQAGRATLPAGRVEVPTAVAQFPGELAYPPRSQVEVAYNLVRWSHPASGGHFAAMEAPGGFAADVREFFASLR